MIRKPLRSLAGAVLAGYYVLPSYAQSPVIKVDFDMAGRPEAEVSEPGFTSWPIADAASVDRNVESVAVALSHTGNGTGLRSTWYKSGIQAPHYARLASDGVTVKDGNDGGGLRMTLSGLPAGEHSLLLYLNTVDSPESLTFAPVDISLDGELVIDNLQPSNRVTANNEAQIAYLTFISDGSELEVLIQADSASTATSKNVVLNGFELNTPNSAHQAKNPVPGDGDQHVEADEGSLTLQWTAAPGAVSHELYFGTDAEQVAAGDSAVHRGSYSDTGVEVSGLYSRDLYYWRVDQVDGNGMVTRGNVWSFRPRQLAFPDAEGYGRFAIGGRGGAVVKVTNLNDSGPGSLRAAVEDHEGPRTIVFDVSGLITLDSRLTLSDSFVTVAGQTAPGKGITVRGAAFGMSGVSDVVMQNIRVRLGAGETYDGIGMAGSNHSIVDHSSISWTIDEAFSSRNGKNITLQRTLISEALNVAGHENYGAGKGHGFAASISGDIGSFHHNLLAHNDGRNWSLAGGLDGDGNFAGRLDIFNNVVYNWRSRTTDGGAHEVNFVNNYYKPGPATEMLYALRAQYESFPGTQQYYFAGNVMPGRFDETNQAAGRTYTGNPDGYSPWVDEPFFPSHATIHTAEQAYKNVLSDVGANQPMLDDHDIRIINETLEGSYTFSGSYTGYPGLPDHEDDVGGYENYPEVHRDSNWDSDDDGLPDWWERIHGLNPNSAQGDFADANRDTDGDGYTALDDYLQWLSAPHVETVQGTSVAIDVPTLFRGYTDQPRYSLSNVSNGSATIQGEEAVFAPAECGLASFDVTVTDAAGDSMTRKVGVFVDSNPAGSCESTPGKNNSSSSSSLAFGSNSSSSSSAPAANGSSGGGGAFGLGWLSLLLGVTWYRKQGKRKK